jgi:hypothetical protein
MDCRNGEIDAEIWSEGEARSKLRLDQKKIVVGAPQ